MINFAKRLREERAKIYGHQKDFAQLMEISEVTQSNYENGKRIPDAEYLNKAAKAGIDVNYVITGEKCISQEKMEDLNEIEKKLSEALALLQNIKSKADA